MNFEFIAEFKFVAMYNILYNCRICIFIAKNIDFNVMHDNFCKKKIYLNEFILLSYSFEL